MSEQEEERRTDQRHRLNDIEASLKEVREKVVRIEGKAESMNEQLARIERNTVSSAEFLPVKLVVYGLAGTILLTVLGSILTLLLRYSGKA